MNEDLALAFKEVTGMDFDNFYKKYRPKLIYYLTKYTKCHEKSEDFADDAFIQALLKIRSYNSDKSQIHTWIYKIGENLVIKDFKDNQRFATVSIDKTNDDNLNISNMLVCDYEKELEKEMVLQSKTNVIYDAIRNLPSKYKTVMEMREIKKMSYVAISEACVSEFDFEIDGYKTMPHPKEFLDIKILNTSNNVCNIIFSYEGTNEKIMFDCVPDQEFYIDSDEINNLNNIDIVCNGIVMVHYRSITNLATIKSQIRAGRTIIRDMIKHKIHKIDNDGY